FEFTPLDPYSPHVPAHTDSVGRTVHSRVAHMNISRPRIKGNSCPPSLHGQTGQGHPTSTSSHSNDCPDTGVSGPHGNPVDRRSRAFNCEHPRHVRSRSHSPRSLEADASTDCHWSRQAKLSVARYLDGETLTLRGGHRAGEGLRTVRQYITKGTDVAVSVAAIRARCSSQHSSADEQRPAAEAR